MKNKSAVLVTMGMMMFLAGTIYAAASVRSPKNYINVGQSTNSIGVSSGPAVLYAVTIATGAVTDFVTIFDSNSVVGLTSAQMGGNFRMRLYPSSTTQNTSIVFDPPIQFRNGIIAIPGTALTNYLFVYEQGRISY